MLEKGVIGLMSNRKEVCVRLAGIQWSAYRGCPDCVKKQMYTKLEYYGDGIVCLCTKLFSRPDSLKRHQKTYGSRNKPDTYTWSVCSKQF